MPRWPTSGPTDYKSYIIFLWESQAPYEIRDGIHHIQNLKRKRKTMPKPIFDKISHLKLRRKSYQNFQMLGNEKYPTSCLYLFHFCHGRCSVQFWPTLLLGDMYCTDVQL